MKIKNVHQTHNSYSSITLLILTRPWTSVEFDSHAHLSGVVAVRQESNFRRPNRRIQFLFVFQVRVDVTDQYL